ncbi:MAG: hypothetical protein K8S16_16515 [Bacteroidales bacterium]|nr:hypothetical protein [Bacteroidales bacterium]
MKRLVFLIIVMALCTSNYAQNIKTIDVITLKDSTILKGEIIENVINDYISLKTTNGQVKIIKYEDILKTGKQKLEFDINKYGGDFSCGVALAGGGIVGVPVRYFLTSTIPFEFGIHLRPVLALNESNNNSDLTWNVLFAGTFDFYFSKRLNEYKGRVQMNGMFIKGGYHTGKKYRGTIVALGWAYERFKIHHKNYSVSFELGVGLDFLTDKELQDYYDSYNSSYYGYSYDKSDAKTMSPMIYWKVGWNFFVK